ncbi:hypothetical protein RN22_14695 [Grimontia sp. AD028]|uniref:DUF418 domain-containing protein n=1 Tax=Grimontia sp. AD028 TaxID=1581149 RepID=UPI00061B506F|nr:DUF418 domain-containing protein [Grimontia sp. AD028]KKD59687.1 hypothetical protein RN22_14695 [Grimontia sp. AD028]
MTTAPPNPTERILSLDVIRGIAILGILFMNIFAQQALPALALHAPDWQGTATDMDMAVYTFQAIFLDGRFMSLFSLLFGVGLVIQTESWQRKQQSAGKWISRRLFWLAVIGLLHAAFIWPGDVLFVYAITGLVIFRAANWRARTQLILGVFFAVLAALLFLALSAAVAFSPPEEALPPIMGTSLPVSPDKAAELIQAATGNYFFEQIPLRLEMYYRVYISGLPVLMFHVGGLMLIGMGLYKTGFFNSSKRLIIWCVVGVLTASASASLVNFRNEIGFNEELGLTLQLLNMSMSPLLSLCYAKLLIWLVEKRSVIVQPFAACGRMAFTLYLSQSFIAVAIFQWLLPDLYGTLNRAPLISIVLLMSVVQVLFANYWLKHHRMGPLEKVWRRLALGKKMTNQLKQAKV